MTVCVSLTFALTALGRYGGRDADTGDDVVVLRAPVEGAVLIAAGQFLMGSEISEIQVAQQMCRDDRPGGECERSLFADEMLAHDVILRAYWIDRTEVTNAAYRRLCHRRGVKP